MTLAATGELPYLNYPDMKSSMNSYHRSPATYSTGENI